MAGVSIPLELKPINKQFEAAVGEATASVKQLTAEVKALNDTLAQTIGTEGIKNIETLGKTVSQTGQAYQQSAKQVEASNQGIIGTISNTKKQIESLVKIVKTLIRFFVPLRLVFFGSAKEIARLRISIIKLVVQLRLQLLGSLIAIKFAFRDLVKSRNINEFFINLTQLADITKSSFNGLKKTTTELADEVGRFDPLADLLSGAVKVSAVFGALAVTLKTVIGPAFFNTSSLIRLFGKGLAQTSGISSILAGRLDIIADKLTRQSGLVAAAGRGFKIFTKGFLDATNASFRFGSQLDRTGSVLKALGTTRFAAFSKAIRTTIVDFKLFGNAASQGLKQSELFAKGLFGTTARISAVGTGLFFLGKALKQVDNILIKFTGNVVEFIGIALAPFQLFIVKIIGSIGDFIAAAGTRLVNTNIAAAQSFQDAEQRAFVFSRTVDSFSKSLPLVVGKTGEWVSEIEKLNKETGETEANLQTAVTEIVALGSEIGLSNSQLKLLLQTSVDFNAFVKGNLVETTLDLLSGIQGNSQAVDKFGINLREQSVQLALAKNGINANVSSLSDLEKIQARLLVVESKSAKQRGLAAALTQTFAGLTKLTQARLAQLNAEFGKGANVVENYAVIQRGLLLIVENIPEPLAQIAGFLSAITGRLLQITGVTLKFSFALALVVSSIAAFNTFVNKVNLANIFRKQIPLLNRSLFQLIGVANGATLEIKSFGQLLKLFGALAVQQSKRLIAAALGIEVATLSLGTATRALGRQVIFLNNQLLKLIRNPIVATVLLIVGGIILLISSFKKLEELTGAVASTFTLLGQIVDDLFKELFGGIGVIDIVISAFKSLMIAVKSIFGVIVSIVARVFASILRTIASLPDAVVSADKKIRLQRAASTFARLDNQIKEVAFNLERLPQSASLASRGIASVFSAEVLNRLPKELKKIAEDLKDAGKTQTQIIIQSFDERNAVIVKAIAQQRISTQQGNQLLIKLQLEKNQKLKEIEQKRIQELQTLAAEFGGTAALRQQEEEKLNTLKEARARGLLTERQSALARLQIESDFQTKRNAIEVQLGGQQAQEAKLKREIAFASAANSQKLITETEFQIRKQQLELEFEQQKFERTLLTEQELENQKAVIRQSAAENQVTQNVNNQLRLAGRENDIRVNRLAAEQEALTQIANDESRSIDQRNAAKKRLTTVDKQLTKERLNIAREGFDGLASLTQSSNKTLFAIGKASAVASATISGFLSIQNALAIQPFFPLGLLLAAGAAARFATNLASISGTNLQTGGIIPGGFPNDSFRANLTSGERVVNVQQNKDLSEFLAKEKTGSGSNEELAERFDAMIKLQKMTVDALEQMGGDVVVNVGNKELFKEIRTGLRQGRTISA
jgi:hypothetical protein